jgi:hypothetical protein
MSALPPKADGASAQRFYEAPKLDSCLGSGTVAVIAIPLAFTMHSFRVRVTKLRAPGGRPAPGR